MNKRLIFYAESRAIGGDSKYLYELINNIRKEGYSVKCFCNPILIKHLRERVDKEISIESIQTKHAEFPDTKINSSNLINRKVLTVFREFKIICFPFLRTWCIVRNILTIYRVFKKEKIDIVHINNGGYPAAEGCIAAVFAAKISGIKKVVMSTHNLAREPYRWGTVLEKIIDKMVANNLDKIIVATASVKKSLVERRFFSEKLISKISYGVINSKQQEFDVDIREEFNILNNTKILIASARFDGTKGQEYLLKALSLLKNSRLKFKCFLLGEGSLRKQMIQLSKKLNIEDYVIFTGYRKDVYRFLHITDILIQPSISYENSPYSVLEAMSFGIPVIGTSIGGTSELVKDGITGFIVPPKNSKAIYDVISLLLENEKKCREMGLAGKNRVSDNFNMKNSIKRTSELYIRGI